MNLEPAPEVPEDENVEIGSRKVFGYVDLFCMLISKTINVNVHSSWSPSLPSPSQPSIQGSPLFTVVKPVP